MFRVSGLGSSGLAVQSVEGGVHQAVGKRANTLLLKPRRLIVQGISLRVQDQGVGFRVSGFWGEHQAVGKRANALLLIQAGSLVARGSLIPLQLLARLPLLLVFRLLWVFRGSRVCVDDLGVVVFQGSAL